MNCHDCRHFKPANFCRHPKGAFSGRIAVGATALRMNSDMCGPTGAWFEPDPYREKCIERGMDAIQEMEHDAD